MSSITRAFTMRRKRTDSGVEVSSKAEDMPSSLPPKVLHRASTTTTRRSKRSVDISKISAPVQLLSTTNMLTYDAPDVKVIQAQRKASSSVSSGSSSIASDNDDASSTSSQQRDTQLTDASSVGSISPVSSPSDDKKMAFFESTPAIKGSSTLRRSISTLEIRHPSADMDMLPRSESPAIPQRHPSHSKKAHAELARQRSMQTMSSSSMSRAHSIASPPVSRRETRSSAELSVPQLTTTPPTPSHPFGKELQQLDMVAEEFSIVANDAERASDLQAMRERGLIRFCAADYVSEIQPLFSSYVHTHLSAPQHVGWI